MSYVLIIGGIIVGLYVLCLWAIIVGLLVWRECEKHSHDQETAELRRRIRTQATTIETLTKKSK